MRADYCPLPLSTFAFVNGDGDIARLHRACHRLLISRCTTVRSWGRLLISTLAWPFSSLLRSLAMAARHGGSVARRHGVSRWRQVGGSMRAAMHHNMNARLFYWFDLFRPDAPDPGTFIMPHELKVIAEVLATTSMVPDISTKTGFLRCCNELGLPHVPILASFFSDGRSEWGHGGQDAAIGNDLLLKPADWAEGPSGELWKWQEGKGNWQRQGKEADLREIEARGRELAVGHIMLMQPFVPDHPVLRRLGMLGTCTLRFSTLAVLGGEPQPLYASLRIPGGWWRAESGPETDMVARVVDFSTGELGEAVARCSHRRWKRHPDTGEAIAGLRLPLWDQAMALAARAHRNMLGYPVMAWDILIGVNESLLLDACVDPAIDLAHVPLGGPVGDRKFAASVLVHCERLGSVTAVA
ncbi:sugar-transfer associated ATP-grasp domain-containing protein [Nitratidesulfovibrio sp.]|uniref:sugar-transfer associated ATP-grasp domain-containing protein n=1 Tax=Nitratidesulfovibrio sp. TaxID=2802297 RepID=UPI00333FC225